MSIEVPVLILLIAIPTYFILKWILKKWKIDSNIKRAITIIGTIILAPILYLGCILIFMSYIFYQPQYDFNTERWNKDKNSRYEMKDDIVESDILKGKSKFEIIELIGKPENNDTLNIWSYNLGTSSAGFGWQFNSLQLNFENNKVIEVKNFEIID